IEGSGGWERCFGDLFVLFFECFCLFFPEGYLRRGIFLFFFGFFYCFEFFFFFFFFYLIHTAGKPKAYGIARKNIARHIKPQLSWGRSDTQQQLPRGPFPNPTAIVMVWPI